MGNNENTSRGVDFNPGVRSIKLEKYADKTNSHKFFYSNQDEIMQRRAVRGERSSKPQSAFMEEVARIAGGYKDKVIGQSEVGIEPNAEEMRAQDVIDDKGFKNAMDARDEANKEYFKQGPVNIDTNAAMAMAVDGARNPTIAVTTAMNVALMANQLINGVTIKGLQTTAKEQKNNLTNSEGGFTQLVADGLQDTAPKMQGR